MKLGTMNDFAQPTQPSVKRHDLTIITASYQKSIYMEVKICDNDC